MVTAAFASSNSRLRRKLRNTALINPPACGLPSTAAQRTALVPYVTIGDPSLGATLRELYQQDTPIIALCAAGIVIRTLAPLLLEKGVEPAVLAVAEDGSAVVPLLGGGLLGVLHAGLREHVQAVL